MPLFGRKWKWIRTQKVVIMLILGGASLSLYVHMRSIYNELCSCPIGVTLHIYNCISWRRFQSNSVYLILSLFMSCIKNQTITYLSLKVQNLGMWIFLLNAYEIIWYFQKHTFKTNMPYLLLFHVFFILVLYMLSLSL